MIKLHVDKIFIIINLDNIILEQASSSNVKCRFTISRGEIEFLVNPISKEVIGTRSLVNSLSFSKASR